MADETKVKRLSVSGSLKGEDGITPHIGENGNWWIGEEDTGISAGGGGSSLPPVAAEDDGKVLMVVSGKWSATELPQYEGNTEVTPSTSEQTLATAGKMISENISVNPIQYAEISNIAGGKTVTIGG